MSIDQLLRDYGVPYVTQGEHKHSSSGWINVHCPYCAGGNFHMGISLENPFASHCWKCGSHSTVAVLSRILHMPEKEVHQLIEKYHGGGVIKRERQPKVSIKPLRLPRPCGELNEAGKEYLHKRGYDPEKLRRVWRIKQTGPVSYLDKVRYGNRILIPIHWGGEMVSFQTRDITGKAEPRYLACPIAREKAHHKHIVYGKQERWERYNALIVVEGVFDVWRLGPSAVATFGTAFTMEQVLALNSAHERFVMLYDNEPQAQELARKLAVKLRALGKKVTIETVPSDPGEMEQEDANHLVKELQRRVF